MDLLIRHDRTGERVDVGIADGVIVAVAAEGVGLGARELDADGALISPALIESHFHLENALLWDIPNRSGTLEEAIRLYAAIKREQMLAGLPHPWPLSIQWRGEKGPGVRGEACVNARKFSLLCKNQ